MTREEELPTYRQSCNKLERYMCDFPCRSNNPESPAVVEVFSCLAFTRSKCIFFLKHVSDTAFLTHHPNCGGLTQSHNDIKDLVTASAKHLLLTVSQLPALCSTLSQTQITSGGGWI